ncbi:MAG: IS3 family transposase [Acidobacteria bacterium]|nr:IS3 family transposase [Acidobacteriota bacterium]
MTVERKREAVILLKTKMVSERRSCQLLMSRSTCRYRLKREPDAEFERAVKELAVRHPRFGYRRVHALFKRGNLTVNRKRVARVWQKFGLQVPARTQKKKRAERGGEMPAPVATRPNEVWTYDFVFDRDAAGRKLKMLTLIDEFTREGLAIQVGRSFKSEQVKEVLAEVGAERGFPNFIRSDNGSEFIARIVTEYLAVNKVKTAFIEPGSPWQNGKGESFNRRFRDECLRMEVFGNWREAAVIAETWRKYYNRERPHSSLNYQSPREFRRSWETGQALLREKSTGKLAIEMAQTLGA